MTEEKTTVQGGTEDGVPSKGTPAPAGVAPATPAQTPEDARSIELKQQIEKYQRDINQIKSASQKRESELQKTLSQREREFQQQLEQARISSMDEDERKIYEVERNKERMNELEQQLMDARATNENLVAFNNAYTFFIGKKVPASALVTDQGFDELVASGWNYISGRLEELEAAVSRSSQQTPPQEPPRAPSVEVGTGSPVGGPTWEDLERKYGSREAVYTLIEQRRLPPDILPK